ncbi:hypothetical protein [Kitasatospora aureofaciens]|uniref:hypothetical protein n=1 Tax=Kitasatospora aureofaciens TaxID=1894 RepID=UPI00210CAFBD|nr:hypothetical protein [Kitasatospora aureofaciens]
MAGDHARPGTPQAEQQVLVNPGYLAGPGELDTSNAAFAEFLTENRGWARYSCDGGDTSVAVSDCLTGRIQLDYEPGDRNPPVDGRRIRVPGR